MRTRLEEIREAKMRRIERWNELMMVYGPEKAPGFASDEFRSLLGQTDGQGGREPSCAKPGAFLEEASDLMRLADDGNPHADFEDFADAAGPPPGYDYRI